MKVISFAGPTIALLIAIVVLFPPGEVTVFDELKLDSFLSEVPPVDVSRVANEVSALLKLDTVSLNGEPYSLPPASQTNIRESHTLLREFYPTLFARTSVETIHEFSLLLRLPGSNSSLRPALVMCHLDVVPVEEGTEGDWGIKDGCKECGPFSGAISGGYVWGRGALDMKSTCVSFLHAAERLLTRKEGFRPQRSLYFAIGHDEETSGEGQVHIVQRLFDEGIELEAVLDEGNPTIARGTSRFNQDFDLAMPGLAEKGTMNVELSVTSTSTGHAAIPPLEGTPISIVADAVRRLHGSQAPAELRRPITDMFDAVNPALPQPLRFLLSRRTVLAPLIAYALTFDTKTAALVRTTSAATVFHAGVKLNVIPQRAVAIINHRLVPGDTMAAALERDRRAIADPRVALRILPKSREASAVTGVDTLVFRAVAGAIRASMPTAVIAPALFTAGSDSRHYDRIAAGRIVKYFPFRWTNQDLAAIHSTDERVRVEALETSVRFYSLFFLAMARPEADLASVPSRNSARQA